MSRKSIFFISMFLLSISTIIGQETQVFFDKADIFFNQYIKEGKVDYNEIKNNPKQLEELTLLMESMTVHKNSKLEYQAFWINAYNILVIKEVVAEYPIKSPLDVEGFFDVKKNKVAGLSITLNDIENKLLRGNFLEEARFHFVLVCAGLGCPPIIKNAYVPSKLEMQLQEQTVAALNNPKFIMVNGNKVKVSQLFEWYKKDFMYKEKSLVDFINTYREIPLPENAKTSYYPYDWRLNEIK